MHGILVAFHCDYVKTSEEKTTNENETVQIRMERL